MLLPRPCLLLPVAIFAILVLRQFTSIYQLQLDVRFLRLLAFVAALALKRVSVLLLLLPHRLCLLRQLPLFHPLVFALAPGSELIPRHRASVALLSRVLPNVIFLCRCCLILPSPFPAPSLPVPTFVALT